MQTTKETRSQKTTRKETKKLNGVDVAQLHETVENLKDNPELAQFKFRARNTWDTGAHTRVKIEGYYGAGQEWKDREKPFTLETDEPEVLLGTDKAPSPGELLLAALSACMTTSLACHSAAQGMKVESIESEYEGDVDLQGFLGLDPKVRNGFNEIRIRIRAKGDWDQKTMRELLEKSPVLDSLRNPVTVKIAVEKA